MNLIPVGTSRRDVPAREVAGGTVAPLNAAQTARRAIPTRFSGNVSVKFRFRICLSVVWLLATARASAATNSESSGDIPALLPPHGEIPPTFWEQNGWWVVAGAIVLLALASIAVWFLRRPKPLVATPPEVQARRDLVALSRQTEDGNVLSRVSQVLRRYVAAAFSLSADELTTAEFCRAVASHESIGKELSMVLADFLRRCDERKFAPAAAPTPLDAARRALELVELAEIRRARLREAAAQSAGQPAGRA